MKSIAALTFAMLLAAAVGVAQSPNQSAPETIYTPGVGGASAPKCSVMVQPSYTDDARQAHIQGTVIIDIVIHADGSITIDKVRQSLGHGLDEEARKAATQWQCTPGEVDGHPVSVRTRVEFSFRLG